MTESATGLTISVIVPVHNGGDNFHHCLSQYKNLFHHFYSGLAFAIGLGRFLFAKCKSPKLRSPASKEESSATGQFPERD